MAKQICSLKENNTMKKNKVSFFAIVMAIAMVVYEKPPVKKFLHKMLVAVVAAVLVFGIYTVVKNDSVNAVAEIKAAIFMMSKDGLSEQQILNHYSFRDDPRATILKDLKKTGEFKELVRKGRESRVR
ncbi:MAG TPA: hypothetical protein P5052_02060 [Candidatus Paceibacterota bacterium]|nr:hypothetical protein [Candidatus Paceibacterota bacterium]